MSESLPEDSPAEVQKRLAKIIQQIEQVNENNSSDSKFVEAEPNLVGSVGSSWVVL